MDRRYEFLCDVFSVCAHRVWKNRIARRIAETPGTLMLDVASGTGDIPFRVLRRLDATPLVKSKKLLVTDICPEMLSMARTKLGTGDPRIEYSLLDAHDLNSIESNSVDVYSISFGMKIMDRKRVLSEAHRVLRPGGTFFCLEAARIPVRFVHNAYLKYMDWCLPFIARLATGGDVSAYDYLLRGVHEFPDQRTFATQMENHGFDSVGFENLTLGIVALHKGVKR
jgi:ubiquinone/menaquinone biosynthesis methyltransferase